jgi:subfamily B ATP-binding cassette protein MsbA
MTPRSGSTVAPSGFLTAMAVGFRSMWQRPWLAAVFLVVTFLQGGLQGALVWALRRVLSSFDAAHGATARALFIGSLIIFVIWLLRAFCAFAAETLSVQLSHRVEIGSMLKVLRKLLSLSVRFFDKNSRADVVMASYYDLKGVRTVMLAVGQIVLNVAQLLGLAAAAWMMSPKLALIGLIAVPIGAIPAFWLGQEITKDAHGERTSVTTLYDSFMQIASSMRVIKVNRSEGRLLERAKQIGHELQGHLVRQAKNRGLSRFLLEAVSGLGLILVLTIGGRDVADGQLEWQSLLGLLVAMMAVYSPVVGLLQLYSGIRAVIPSLDRVRMILAEEPEIADRPDARPLTSAPTAIELRDVSFAYEGKAILEGISATFFRGETIGIVGPSGAGKSTLLSLLLRFYDPTSGGIYVDGVDLRDIRHADLMALSAIVLQEPFIFADTVANNIRLGRPEATMDDVIAAAKAANVHDEIVQMEHGYDTLLGTGRTARGVSGGQKQRICIAAALLKNAPVLFLDEATSSLDSLSEMKVQAAIERLVRGRTTFVIAHRLSTLRDADRIIVLDGGRMVGLGTHEELLAQCATYQRLWGHQMMSASSQVPSHPGLAEVLDA